MKKFLGYLFGGAACLGIGAGFYVAFLSAAPAAKLALPVAGRSVTSSVNDLLPLVAKRLGADKPAEASAPAAPVRRTVLFMGDVMLGRSVAAQVAKNGQEYPFAKIKDAVSAADYAVANLEGPLTKINMAPDNRMRFHFDPSLAPILATAGFDAFSLANNHGLDQGAKGESDTQSVLAAAGLKYFGEVSSDAGPVLEFAVGDSKVAVIGLHDVYRKIDPAAAAERIAAAKKAGDIVIVYPHWGEEYKHDHNARQTELAHAFVDAGADAVIGSHPHVVEGAELYKGKPIFYSLGNLVFDQYFSAETQQGLALGLNIGPSGIESVDLLPYEIPQSQPAFSQGVMRGAQLADLASWSDPSLKSQIEAGALEINPGP